jgi:formylglycine-generating enzyme required for sulfatase activity
LFLVIKYTAVSIEKHVRVLASIFDFLNSHRFTLGISSYLIFGFFALSSLISFGQNSLGIGERPPIVVLDLSSGSNGSSYPVTYLGSLPNDWNSTEFKTNKVILKWVDPGVFDMGQTGVTNADIVRQITLTRGFYMGIYEITGSQYEKVIGFDPSIHGGDTKPVDRGTWNEVRGGIWPSGVPSNSSFIGKVRQKTNGDIFDLPTEAQWEFVARAGTSTTYFFGDQNSEMSNYAWDNTSTGSTFEVGLKLPNPWGFFDIYGNAREYCLDYAGSYQPGPQVDPVGLSSSNSGRIIRGSGILSTAARSYVQPDDDSGLRGFRILLNTLNAFPNNLVSVAPLNIQENQPMGSGVGEFNATDPDANSALTYHLVSGVGDESNSLFTLDQNGTLKTATVFDFETNASSYSIRVQARDEFNATTEDNFTVNLTDIFEDLDGDGLSDHLEQVGSTQIRIRAQIDGTSRLVFKKGSIQWNHISAAKPGQHNGANYPTTINGDLDWMPQWNNDISDEFNQTNVDLRGTIQIQPVVARSSLLIVQQPTINNEQTTIVEIFDSGSGPSFYEFILTGDGLSGYLTDPQDPDSDNDGFNDGMEVTSGSDPRINTSTPLNHGLVAWYPFDGNASDMSGNGNHGTVNGATLSTDRHGQTGKAFSFDGMDDYIVVSDSNKFDFENREFSISSWVKKFSQVNSDVGMVLSQWNTGASPGTNQWFLSSSTSGEIGKPNFSYEVANQRFKSTSSSVMGLNEWIHLVGVRESNHTKLFMNGSLISQNVGSSGSVNETGRNLYFGKYRDSNSIFSNISIDESRIYNRALSAIEVQSLYQLENTPPEENATVSGSVQYQGVIPGPAYVWALDQNGTKVAEYILPDGNGSYSLSVPKGRGYDFKVFIDGTGDEYPQAYEVWKHIGDWNSSLGGFNLTQVDGNLSGINFNLFDSDYDSDGFTNWQEYQAGTNQNDANSTPGLNFGLVAWYPFDGNASDMSGNGNHGTVSGATLGTDRHGITGQAYSFDGVDDFIEVQNSNELKFLDQYSILVWVKAPNFQRRYNHIITKMAGSISSFEIYGGYQSGGTGLTLVHNRSLASYHMQYSSSLPDNTWHHFGLTYANGILKRFDDGVSSASYTGWPKVEPQESSLYIGRGTISTSAGTEFMQGCIDNVRIYNRALSATEVQSLYQLESTPQDQNASVSGTVQYNGVISGPAYVWALDANGTKVAEQILADGNGSYSLSVPKGAGYDFKVFIDGTGDGISAGL